MDGFLMNHNHDLLLSHQPYMTTIFSIHEDTKILKPFSYDSNTWPESWRTTYYKEYPRFKTIILPHGEEKSDLFQAIKQRSSKLFTQSIALTLHDIGVLLEYAYGNTRPHNSELDGRQHRTVASGGAFYPIDIYIGVVTASVDLPVGLYHYRVREHALEILTHEINPVAFIKNTISVENPELTTAPVYLFCTGNFTRVDHKYGIRGYRYLLIEVGEILQNIYLVAEALGIKTRALGATSDTAIEKILDIDGVTESHIQTVALGK